MSAADAAIGGGCCYATLFSWCILHPFGADVKWCGGPRGCCGSCCDSSFNKDDFDERLKKEQARNGASTEPVDSQPAPSQGMSTVTDDPSLTHVPDV